MSIRDDTLKPLQPACRGSISESVQAAYELRQIARIAKLTQHVRGRLFEIADRLDPSLAPPISEKTISAGSPEATH